MFKNSIKLFAIIFMMTLSIKSYANIYYFQINTMIFDESYIVLGGVTSSDTNFIPYISRYNTVTESWQKLNIPYDPDTVHESNSNDYNQVENIKVDKYENYYVTTNLGLVWYYNGRWTKIESLPSRSSATYSAYYNMLFVGGIDGEIWGCTPQNCTLLTTTPDTSNVQAMTYYKNSIVISTSAGNIFTWDTHTWSLLATGNVKLMQTYGDSIYFQSSPTGGIVQYDGSQMNSLSVYSTSFMMLDNYGNIYMSSFYQGISMYDPIKMVWNLIPYTDVSPGVSQIVIESQNSAYAFSSNQNYPPYIYMLSHFHGYYWEQITTLPQ